MIAAVRGYVMLAARRIARRLLTTVVRWLRITAGRAAFAGRTRAAAYCWQFSRASSGSDRMRR
jgi:hypothetical protein